jgi:hypothetical protein
VVQRRGLASFLAVFLALTGVFWSWSAGAPRPPRTFDPPAGVLSLSTDDAGGPAFNPGLNDTFYFGGTRWAADSSRWEAIPDSVWTFETGVGSSFSPVPHLNPFKPAGLHTMMEGWIGADNTFSFLPYFRWISGQVGEPACAIAGIGSLYAGVFANEADALCYAAGSGYGNSWYVCIHHDTNFTHTAGASVTLNFKYANDTEPGWDYSYVIADTSGAGDGSGDVTVTSYTGPASGTASLVLAEGTDMRSDSGAFNIKFCLSADGAYSDEDGLYATTCPLVIDNISIVDGITVIHSATFETSNNGWVLAPSTPGAGGEWSNLVSQSDLPWPPGYSGGCDLGDSVLAFYDLATGGHPLYQDNVAVSPWIDLRAADKVGYPGRFLELGGFYELPLRNYVFVTTYAQWYPDTCSFTGRVQRSPISRDEYVRYFSGVPVCASASPRRIDFTSLVPPTAEQVRVGVGVVNWCRYYGDCTHITNSTPWFDDIRFAVATGNTIQSLVDAAAPGDTVLIGAGTYWGSGNRNITFRGKEIVLLAPAGPESTVIDCQRVARGFVIDSGEDSTLVIDGFTVRNGKAPALSEPPYIQDGGGIYIDGKARPTLRNCIIAASRAYNGGGIYVADSSGAIVETTTLRGDTASFGGGGLGCGRNLNVRVEGCTVESNRADLGGGIYARGSGVSVFSSTIQDNAAFMLSNREGGGVYGGDLLQGCLIRRNAAHSGGGCNHSDALVDCLVSENVAEWYGGAGFFLRASGCQFIGNRATRWGGGALILSDAQVLNCVFAGNRADTGGAFYWASYMPFSSGQSVGQNTDEVGSSSLVRSPAALGAPEPAFVGCTIVGNHARNGGGGVSEAYRPIRFLRCVLWGNCADSLGGQIISYSSADTAVFTCSAIDTSGHAFNGPVVYDGPQVFTDPLFCSPASCYGTPTTAGDYHLTAGSPCLPESSPCDSLIGSLGMGCSTTGVPDDKPPVPLTASLRAFPNPFRADVTVVVGIPAGATGAIEIFDVRGRRVNSFEAQAGETALRWDGRSEQGVALPQGLYFVRLHAGTEFKTQRVILIR